MVLNERKTIMSDKEDKHIVRFLDLGAAKSVFRHPDFSTFRLGDAGEYVDIENTALQDIHEGQEISKYGITEENSSLISCWSQMDTREPSSEQWNLFNKSKVVAIVASPDMVKDFLVKSLEKKFMPFICVDHQPVKYYSLRENEYPTSYDQVIFRKDKKFDEEKEYRFAVRISGGRQIRNLTFYTGNWKDFGNVAYLRPDISDQDLQRFLACVSKERNWLPIKTLKKFKNSEQFEMRLENEEFRSNLSLLLS